MLADNICIWFSDPEDTLVTKSCNQLIKGCPDISYLALRGYGVADKRANILLKVCLFQSSACVLEICL